MHSSKASDSELIEDSGLFDAGWYAARYPDVALCGMDPLQHYLVVGGFLQRDPHPLFASKYYISQCGSAETIVNPLLHYLRHGWRAALNPHPLFDTKWYLRANPDIAEAGIEPLWHFLVQGAFEDREPHPAFPTAKVLARCPSLREGRVNPLLHYVSKSWHEDPCPEATAYLQRKKRASVAPAVQADQHFSPQAPPDETVFTDIRAIALYLPQFHTIPENDEWWGEGFTEWTNVRRATPQFAGHYQPHVPHRDLGYYDLNDPRVLEKQAAMARAAGIEGFCFYYYWFNGKRLLEMPTDRLLASGRPDFPFCFCWANENWTRTWDGMADGVLIGQEHSEESDHRFIRDLMPAFRDRRYIRVDGRPVLLVYRPGLLPDFAATARRWREDCLREAIGDLYLVGVRSFLDTQKAAGGLDAELQFPPLLTAVPNLVGDAAIQAASDFSGAVFDYRELVEIYLRRLDAGDPAIPGICPSWDNTARRMERGTAWIHSSPALYNFWLKEVSAHVRSTRAPSERLVFINAWNEWAEGCHLEPDEKHGYAWINATREALSSGAELGPALRILAIGHDAFRAGAQIVLLQLLRELMKTGQVEVRLLLRGDGALRTDYEEIVPTVVLEDGEGDQVRSAKLAELLAWGPDVTLSNTVVNGPLLAELAAQSARRIPVVTHVHELQKSIERWAPGEIMGSTVRCSDHFIAVSEPVRENLLSTHAVPTEAVSLINAFIDCRSLGYPNSAFIYTKRKDLDLGHNDFVVMACGTTDWRKGPDLFVETAQRVIEENPDARFVWVGAFSDDDGNLRAKIEAAGLGEKLRFIGERADARECVASADVFFLSSREDPYPLVALEAADAAVPIVAFAESGGMPDFIGSEAGMVVAAGDTEAAAEAILRLGRSYPLSRKLGDQGRRKVQRLHAAPRAARSILKVLQDSAGGKPVPQPSVAEKPPAPVAPPRGARRRRGQSSKPLVTVMLPNYNHAPFLNERLESIVNQGIDDLEILLMDDCSRDVSPQILQDFCRRDPRARFLANTTNSGSTFRQWKKGLAEARGEFVWIAESDDAADPELLRSLLALHEAHPETILCYAQSLMLDLSSRPYGPATSWTDDIDPERWKQDYVAPGLEELAVALSVKNTIPNVSAVLFRNLPVLRKVIDENMRLCADWLSYVRLCGHGEIGYCHRPLNRWRLASSNARTKPPGETEWLEGARIYDEIGRLLRWTDEELQLRREEFRRKCDAWKEAA